MEHLHGEVEYQVSHAGLRFRSARLDACAPWESVARHRLDDDHLRVWCAGMPPLVLPRAELERAGFASVVLERVLDAEAAAAARSRTRLGV